MFRKMISFTIKKDDSNRIVDSLSRFGECGMHATKEGKAYDVTIVCDIKAFQKCLDAIMILAHNGVLFANMDIRMSF